MKKHTLVLIALLFIALFSISSSPLFAGGRKDNESHEARDPGRLDESLNLEGKRPGKWNFYLEAQDKAGNTSTAGPYNIFIDPA